MLSGELEVGHRRARWWFTDRRGGRSIAPYDSLNVAAHVGDETDRVRTNREILADAVADGVLSWMGPTHGTAIATIETPVSITPNVDALLTTRAGTPLVTLAADCVPLLLAAGDAVVAAHIGWRGFVDGMTMTIVRALADLGIVPRDAQVLLGPAICGSCYGVPEERAAAVANVSAQALTTARNGGPGVDIRAGLVDQWQSLGASVQRIGGCTFEDPTYFSHRRDGVTGRQAGVIAWQR